MLFEMYMRSTCVHYGFQSWRRMHFLDLNFSRLNYSHLLVFLTRLHDRSRGDGLKNLCFGAAIYELVRNKNMDGLTIIITP